MSSKWPLRGFEPQIFIFEEKNMILIKKKAMEKARFEPAIIQSQV
jgi:isopentenyldiphosphate isomerase